jgi:hypothetical protein
VNILITSAAAAIAHQLKNKLNNDTVVLGDYLELPESMLRSGKMIRLPNPASVSYNHEILTLCLDQNIGAIYPLRDEERNALKESEQLFKEYSIVILEY